ncbi:MAG: histidine kinase [Candidatus Kapabacteria bacterium]|nr:histidine kinase [Candidatus Kapabacteria bacterium]
MYLLITTGGVLSPFLWIMGGIPILPAVLLDIERNGKIWVGITVIGVSCIGVAQYMGVKMAVMVTSSYLTFTIFAATVPLIVYMMIYLVGKQRLHREELLLNEKKEEEFRSHLLQAHLVRLQLQNLRSQIQPHFLFNTLNSITALIRWNKQEQAIEAVNNLASILRFTLQDSLDDMIPLHEEINVIKQYIALEQIRFSNAITLSLHISEKLQAVLIPCFCIQLLVENSIKHGFRNLESQGRIIVEAREYLSENLHDNLSENLITISVMDNGIGLPKNWSRNHYGVGLTNLEERLTLLFGKRVTLQLQSNISNGTIASITFPSSA